MERQVVDEFAPRRWQVIRIVIESSLIASVVAFGGEALVDWGWPSEGAILIDGAIAAVGINISPTVADIVTPRLPRRAPSDY